ncbi:MAG: hypothetical protein FJW27_02370 [Acidimicrobiia bacterium]|nr:hypothetical protein [Acidimicrobiia bacterium]
MQGPWPPRVASAVLIVLLAATNRAAAQGRRPDQEYDTLLRRYTEGGRLEAVAVVAGWSGDRARAAARTLETGDPRRRAAVMLHADAVLSLPAKSAHEHLSAAEALVEAVSRDAGSRVSETRWRGLQALVYLTRNERVRAERAVNQALTIDVTSADALLVRGALREADVRESEPNLRGRWAPVHEALSETLHKIAQLYRQILSNHPDSLEARLRLGWILLANKSPGNAREPLEAVASRARSPDLRYLAHLFLAALEQREKRLDEAVAHAEQAHKISPQKSSYAALTRLEFERGNLDRVRQLGEQFAAASPTAPIDAWTLYLQGFTGTELIEWLLSQAGVRR